MIQTLRRKQHTNGLTRPIPAAIARISQEFVDLPAKSSLARESYTAPGCLQLRQGGVSSVGHIYSKKWKNTENNVYVSYRFTVTDINSMEDMDDEKALYCIRKITDFLGKL